MQEKGVILEKFPLEVLETKDGTEKQWLLSEESNVANENIVKKAIENSKERKNKKRDKYTSLCVV